MKICCCWLYAISKYGYPPTIAKTYKVIREMAEMGFKYIELEGVGDKNIMEVYQEREGFRKLAADLGMKIVNFCPILPSSVSLDKRKRKSALRLFDIGIEIALHFGSETVQLDSFVPPLKFVGGVPYKKAIKFGRQFKVKVDKKFRWQDQWDVIVDTVRICTGKAKSAGLKLLMEPRVGENVSNTEAILRLMDAVRDESFQAVLDTGHLHAQKEILPLSIEKLGNRIGYLHVSDNDSRDNRHLPLGKGTIDWEGVFLTLKKHRFNGYVGIDIGEVANLEKAYRDSKKFLENIARKLNM